MIKKIFELLRLGFLGTLVCRGAEGSCVSLFSPDAPHPPVGASWPPKGEAESGSPYSLLPREDSAIWLQSPENVLWGQTQTPTGHCWGAGLGHVCTSSWRCPSSAPHHLPTLFLQSPPPAPRAKIARASLPQSVVTRTGTRGQSWSMRAKGIGWGLWERLPHLFCKREKEEEEEERERGRWAKAPAFAYSLLPSNTDG